MWNRIIFISRISQVLVFLTISALSFSQMHYTDTCDLKFVSHLVNTGNFNEALYILDSSSCSALFSDDNVNYLRGWSQYSLKKLLPSSESFIKVGPQSEFYLKSHFFAAYNYSHTGYYNKSIEILSGLDLKTEKQKSLAYYELAGVYLLQANYKLYEESIGKVNKSIYEISLSSDNLQKIFEDVRSHKRKSPFLAGFISGLIPGSGKFYAGKRGEAISAFLATTGLGLVTWENYRKTGLNSFSTIAFGTAFAFSYAANIYGAVITVNILETEYNDNVKNSILFNLHIPLRNTFDK